MGPREVCFLIGTDDAVLWSDASSSPTLLPDSRERWDAIWSNRERLIEIAHTHPLGGAHFSSIDETTMTALDSALGRKLRYSVVTPSAMLRRTWLDDEDFSDAIVNEEPWWTSVLRICSGVPPTASEEE